MKQAFKPSSNMVFNTVQSDCERLFSYCRDHNDDCLKLDLSEVRHCDSAGLALLIQAKRLSNLNNKSCQIEGIPSSIHALAEFCGVNGILSE